MSTKHKKGMDAVWLCVGLCGVVAVVVVLAAWFTRPDLRERSSYYTLQGIADFYGYELDDLEVAVFANKEKYDYPYTPVLKPVGGDLYDHNPPQDLFTAEQIEMIRADLLCPEVLQARIDRLMREAGPLPAGSYLYRHVN